MAQSERLKGYYRLLLVEQGVTDRPAPSPERVHELVERYVNEMVVTARAEGVHPVWAGDAKQLVAELSKRRFGLQAVLDDLVDRVDRALSRAGLTVPLETYVVEFPTGSINAQASLVPPQGALILVNRGLMMFVHEVTKILSLAFRFTKQEGERVVEEPALGTPQLDLPTIYTLVAEVLWAYLVYGSPQYAQQLPVQGAPRAFLAAAIVEACELFAVAHEFGHASAGHLRPDGSKKTRYLTGGGQLILVEKSHAEEYEADEIAVRLMIASAEEGEAEQALHQLLLAVAVAAPLLFFALDELVTSAGEALFGPGNERVLTDHPPSELRAARIRKVAGELGLPDSTFGIAEPMLAWLARSREEVLNALLARRAAAGTTAPA